ncbi:MAG: hypothetical protein HY327_01545 [Chloroflexi bacterium]|nr:hypothetical protein [Chloroflexota bacterium]
MSEVLDCLFFIAGIFAPYLISAVVRGTRYIRDYFEPILRIRLDTRVGRETFQGTKTVYCRIHTRLRDRFEEVEAWLKEQPGTEDWEEIYLVARRLDRINGVLYTSVYPKYGKTRYSSPMCFVNCIVANHSLTDKEALKVSLRLWNRLQDEVFNCTKQPSEVCRYFFEAALPGKPPRGGTKSEEDEDRRRKQYVTLLEEIGAQQVGLDYRIPNMDDYSTENELEALLLYKGPLPPLSMAEVLKFVYGFHYFSEFIYGEEMVDIDEWASRLRYVQDLISRVRGSDNVFDP